MGTKELGTLVELHLEISFHLSSGFGHATIMETFDLLRDELDVRI
jgi:hypothetical protein